MVIYKDPRKVKKISIPSIPDSEVELYDSFLWGDVENIVNTEGDLTTKGVVLLKYLIKDWNLTDEKGEKLPIDEKTFNTFTIDIINYLIEQSSIVKDKTLEEKKTN